MISEFESSQGCLGAPCGPWRRPGSCGRYVPADRSYPNGWAGGLRPGSCGRGSLSLKTPGVGTVFMKVQLVVVRGKPEGKVIPLVGPNFKIGRGETCHLRPNSEQVSREHAEFTIDADAVIVRDLGSRNGTLVNGKALTAELPPQGPRPGPGRPADLRRLDPGGARAPAAAKSRRRAAGGSPRRSLTRRRLERRDRFLAARRGRRRPPPSSPRPSTAATRSRSPPSRTPGLHPQAASLRPPPATTNTSVSPRKRSR